MSLQELLKVLGFRNPILKSPSFKCLKHLSARVLDVFAQLFLLGRIFDDLSLRPNDHQSKILELLTFYSFVQTSQSSLHLR